MNITTREELAAWLDNLADQSTLIAPSNVEGVLLYRPVKDSREVLWDFTRPVLSIKEAFIPATERLLTIEKTGQQIQLVETLPEGEQVIFGVRPCDARGVKMLDALFTQHEPVDPYYARRRANTTLVGLACEKLGPTCFCTSMGGAPDDPGGMDVMLYPAEEGYLVQAVTEKGRALLSVTLPSPVHASDGEGKQRRVYLDDPDDRVDVHARSAWSARFEDDYWHRLAERCLSCRVCAYVCPTCRCFDVRDEMLPSENGDHCYERIRCWDSCAGEVYRRIAGGHNPRAAKGQRLRNRYLCKFDYYPRQYSLGTAACTGCGRCIDACPVNIDITEVMAHLVEVSR